MDLPELSIQRPVLISSAVILMLAGGGLLFTRLGLDMYPDVTFPVVTVTVPYPGAGPEEVVTQVLQPLEDQIGAVSGLSKLRGVAKEGVGTLIAEFDLGKDIKDAEQQMRDRVSYARRRLPDGVEEPLIRRIDPGDLPILAFAVDADLPPAMLFDLADDVLRPALQKVPDVGVVEVLGGRKRQILVELDRGALSRAELSASQVSDALRAAGRNIPAGRISRNGSEVLLRTLGEFASPLAVGDAAVSFRGNDVPLRVRDLGRVTDGLEDEQTRAFHNGRPAIYLQVYRQSGANTVEVVRAVKAEAAAMASRLSARPGSPKLEPIMDGSKPILESVKDVQETIYLGIVLTFLVVFLFLGNVRSTLITGLAIPNSLIGSFVLLYLFGFTINIMTLLAMSLAVGLLVDDAIVVRENVFKRLEKGEEPTRAALEGTREVALAVVATTATVVAVFLPLAFLKGVVGQFFMEFGLTVVFAMLISLFDALTVAPMLSAYFAGRRTGPDGFLARFARALERLQAGLEDAYGAALRASLKRPGAVLAGAALIFAGSLAAAGRVPKTFLSPEDNGIFAMSIELEPGASLNAAAKAALEVDAALRSNPEVRQSKLVVGTLDNESHRASFYVELVPRDERSLTTTEFKERLRTQLAPYARWKPMVMDYDHFGAGQRPFNLVLLGGEDDLPAYASRLYEGLRSHPGLIEPELSHKPGKPEVRFLIDPAAAQGVGLSAAGVGRELRAQVEGETPAVLREKGREYDVRVRMREEDRDLGQAFPKVRAPNMNGRLIPVSAAAKLERGRSPAAIERSDRMRSITIAADIAPGGPGLHAVMKDFERELAGPLAPPPGITYRFEGHAERFVELVVNMALAAALGAFFIYLVLASLYESFVTPLTIMLVLPLAASGAFLALWLLDRPLDIFSMIGMILLLGIATKNSILLVDRARQLGATGLEDREAAVRAGLDRLRPILMTSVALVAGMIPVAVGLNEASAQRTGMGVTTIGGIVSSTLLTLFVIPAAYAAMERFRKRSLALARSAGGLEQPAAAPVRNRAERLPAPVS